MIVRNVQVLFLSGVSKYKQAFSVGEDFKLLVRSRICCCIYSLDREFSKCLSLVSSVLIYLDPSS